MHKYISHTQYDVISWKKKPVMFTSAGENSLINSRLVGVAQHRCVMGIVKQEVGKGRLFLSAYRKTSKSCVHNRQVGMKMSYLCIIC